DDRAGSARAAQPAPAPRLGHPVLVQSPDDRGDAAPPRGSPDRRRAPLSTLPVLRGDPRVLRDRPALDPLRPAPLEAPPDGAEVGEPGSRRPARVGGRPLRALRKRRTAAGAPRGASRPLHLGTAQPCPPRPRGSADRGARPEPL